MLSGDVFGTDTTVIFAYADSTKYRFPTHAARSTGAREAERFVRPAHAALAALVHPIFQMPSWPAPHQKPETKLVSEKAESYTKAARIIFSSCRCRCRGYKRLRGAPLPPITKRIVRTWRRASQTHRNRRVVPNVQPNERVPTNRAGEYVPRSCARIATFRILSCPFCSPPHTRERRFEESRRYRAARDRYRRNA